MFKVMIVDNESTIRKGLSHCIQWESISCTVVAQAEDGIDALEQFPSIRPDIVISDIHMPGMDGLELARQINQNYPWAKVIMLTGFPDFEYAQRAIEYNVVDFVLKPTSIDTLIKALEKAKACIIKEQSNQKMARELASKSQQNLLLERSMLLHDLINHVDLSHLYVLNRMAQLNLDLSSYHLLRIDVSPIDDTCILDDSLLPYLQQSQDLLLETLSEYQFHQVYVAPLGDQACYIVVCTADTEALIPPCMEMINIIKSMPRFSLSIGISQHWTDPLCMEKAAKQADQAVQFAQYTAEHSVICYDQIPAIPSQVIQQAMHDLGKLKKQIEQRNRTDAHTILSNLFTLAKKNKFPPEYVRSICIYIYQLCLNLPFMSSADELLVANKLPDMKVLIDHDHIEQMENGMIQCLDYVLQQKEEDCADSARVVRIIKNHIAEHYAEDISLETLSELVYLSPTYLSRLFKKETGETLSFYIQNIRIERAKSLLRSTSLKIYEIAEQVGFPDPVYFSRIFKKSTGMKPKDFRENT